MTRDYAMARFARALGCAGYSAEECDALMAWLAEEKPSSGRQQFSCQGCGGTGRRVSIDIDDVLSGEERINGASEQTALLAQGICLGCRGTGRRT